ncbi:WXG100 family type VII secretion target [Amycolatopsis acidiphila]|uniref:WXG100 family type VII secretion target n=1 Tax=Amycolatopsis acidiphila TaxID=715473 RepID=A0A557ZQG5_9PSEU|nr:WXG100 family type VII secretion target [Amycolatopsis acidiphila]TVT14202.1 WXG100 family type VII secretion target [Amycolatopsis acidiphila]UIJ60724.1 WXG100 family type VII secretion target [Amycolatopsis acidiphila]GHG91215.1 ESAT-6-like protein [Amycolatopsis acidiphila]
MANGFTGDPQDFANAQTKVDECQLAMDQNLKKLADQIEATRAGWTGPAAGVFQQVMDAFGEKSTKLNKALADIGEMLKNSGVAYQTQDDDVKSQISQLSQVLEGL